MLLDMYMYAVTIPDIQSDRPFARPSSIDLMGLRRHLVVPVLESLVRQKILSKTFYLYSSTRKSVSVSTEQERDTAPKQNRLTALCSQGGSRH